MSALVDERAQRPGDEGSEIDGPQLGLHHARDQTFQTGNLGGGEGLREQAENQARDAAAAVWILKPLAQHPGEINLLESLTDRPRLEEMFFDELAEFFGDGALIVWNDRGMRDWKPKRPTEQRDDCIPIREAADDRRLGKGADKREQGVSSLQNARKRQKPAACHERRGGQSLHAPEFANSTGVDGLPKLRWAVYQLGGHETDPFQVLDLQKARTSA